MNSLDAALDYAKRGWAIIPVHSVKENGFCSCGAPGDYTSEPKHAVGKHPYTGIHGHRDASKAEMQIKTWWLMWPEANLAIVTGKHSGLIVLDLDEKNGGYTSLGKLERQHGKLPDTAVVHSGGGGKHYYFKHPGFEVRGRRGMLPGIDIQADGGRIVAPPSNHKSGKRYEWDKKLGPDTELADLPRWLLDKILEKQSTKRLKSTISSNESEPSDAKIKVFAINAGGSLLRRPHARFR